MSPQDQVTEFHLAVADAVDRPPTQVLALRLAVLREEFVEVIEALESGDRTAIARELADLAYVTYGTALAFGIDLEAAITAVHHANMSKIGPDGPVLRADGKVMKGSHYRPPDMFVALHWTPSAAGDQ